MKAMDPQFMVYAQEITKGSIYYARDIMMGALYGRGPKVTDINGTEYRPLPVRTNLTELLDNIADVPGSMLYRDENYWVGIPPGEPDQVLFWNDANEVPSWGPIPAATNVQSSVFGRSSDLAATGTWPKYLTANVVLDDQLNIWDPTHPDRLIVPPLSTHIRLSAAVLMTGGVTPTGVVVAFEDAAGNSNFLGNGVSTAQPSTGFANRYWSIQSAWIPVASASAYYRTRVNYSTGSANFLLNSWHMIEAR